jgi:hypothetical protein
MASLPNSAWSLACGCQHSNRRQCEKISAEQLVQLGRPNDIPRGQEVHTADDPVDAHADIDMAAIDGPGQPLEIHTPPPGTKRLSKKGQLLLLGGASTVASAILIGVMISGKSHGQAESNKPLTASDAPGQAAPYKENAARHPTASYAVASAAVTNQATLANNLMANKQDRSQPARQLQRTFPGGTRNCQRRRVHSPPTPAEAHRLWLQETQVRTHPGSHHGF